MNASKKGNKITLSSPRPWGCFSEVYPQSIISRVFPTPVGVFPDIGYDVRISFSLPHARGGVSKA